MTGQKSAFKPRHLLLQLVGEDDNMDTTYEAVASGLHLELQRPYHIAVKVGATGDLPGAAKALSRRRGKAKNVIFLFMEGGPSHLDTFDYKPLLNELAGQKLPPSFKEPILAMGEQGNPILGSKRAWKRHGQSGLWVSDWFPHVATHADDLAVIKSCVSDGINHAGGGCQMNTGAIFGGRPSLGAWVSYGIGTENKNLRHSW